MRLLGDKAWWLPRWLERCLPRLHVEGRPDSIVSPEPAPAGHV
jgi:RND superfamily putative drug exporter